MYIKTTLLSLLSVLPMISGCATGPFVPIHSVESTGLRVAGAAAAVEVLSPEHATSMRSLGEVVGHSCKNMIWDSVATAEDATFQVKISAAQRGANAVTGLVCTEGSFSLVTNCWQSVTCKAIALQGDYSAVMAALKATAEQGDPEAQYSLGAAYANAQPPLGNLAEAERWTRMAAEQGHLNAMVDMAKLILFYQSTPLSDLSEDLSAARYVKAAPWYQRAAERGHPEAQFMIGGMHFSGNGASKDNVRAYMWWTLSASQGHLLAQRVLGVNRDKMTADEIHQAEQLAKQWKPVK